MPKKFTADPAAVEVLKQSTVKEIGGVWQLTLPPRQLPRLLYDEVNKIIKAAGGKWKKPVHVFLGDPRAVLGMATETGLVINPKIARQAFYTPEDVAEWLVSHADVEGCRVLEPSAGHGALVNACMRAGAASVDCIEIDETAFEALNAIPGIGHVTCGDFLAIEPDVRGAYDRVVMNPPFTRGTDVKHITHALKFIDRDGMIFAIVPNKDFTIPGARVSVIQKLAPGAFKESGTEIATRFVMVIHD